MSSIVSQYVYLNFSYPVITGFVLCAFKSLGIVLTGALFAALLERRSARVRSWIWRCTLLACAGLLVLNFVPKLPEKISPIAPRVLVTPLQIHEAQREAINRQWVMSTDERSKIIHAYNDQLKAERKAREGEPPPWEIYQIEPPEKGALLPAPWRQIELCLIPAWLGLAAVFFAWIMVRLIFARRALSKKSRAADARITLTAESVTALLLTGKRLHVRLTADVHSPLLVGFSAPTIYLPEAASTWTNEKLRDVFLHELAHWKRRDPQWLLATRLLACAFWWQPLIAWAGRRLSAEAECAADDVVLAHAVLPANYARSLVEIAVGMPAASSSAGGVAMVGRRELEQRIRALLTENPWRGRFGKLSATLTLILVFGLVAIASTYLGVAIDPPTATALNQNSAVRITPEERAIYQRIYDNTSRRLKAQRYLHFKLEFTQTKTEADGYVFTTPLPTKMEATVDQWTGIHRVDYLPHTFLSNRRGEFSITDKIEINNGERQYNFTESYMPTSDVYRSQPETLGYFLGERESQRVCRIVKSVLDLGVQETAQGKVTLKKIQRDGKERVQITEELSVPNYLQRTHYEFAPEWDDLFVHENQELPANPESLNPRIEIDDAQKSASGYYPTRYRRFYSSDGVHYETSYVVTLFEALSGLPAGLTDLPKTKDELGLPYIAKNGNVIRRDKIDLRCIDATNGKEIPAANVIIQLNRDDKDTLKAALNPDGQLTIPIAPALGEIVRFTIEVRAPGFVAQRVEWVRVGDPLQLPESYTMKLWPASRIFGRVVDETGKPISGAAINVSLWNGSYGPLPVFRDHFRLPKRIVKTDLDGNWSAEGFPQDLRGLSIHISAQGFQGTGPATGDYRTITGRPLETLRDGTSVIALKRGHVLDGKIVDASGKPVRARVVLRNGESLRTSQELSAQSTDNEGNFAFKDLSQIEGWLLVEAVNYKPSLTKINVSSSASKTIKLEAGNVIRGRLIKEDGTPSVGLNVNIEGISADYIGLEFTTQTDKDGRFIWTGAPDGLVTMVFGACQSREFIGSVDVTAQHEEITISMKPPLRITFTAVDAVTKKRISNLRLVPGRWWKDSDTYWETPETKTFADGVAKRWEHRLKQSHIYRLEADGYEPFTTPVYQTNQQDVIETFEMKPTSAAL